MEKVDTIIIGAGLSGIACAARLVAQNKSVVVLEARSRIGGRILCPEYQAFSQRTPLEEIHDGFCTNDHPYGLTD